MEKTEIRSPQLREVDITSIRKAFPKGQVKEIMEIAKATVEMHQCHQNAVKMAISLIRLAKEGGYTVKICFGFFYPIPTGFSMHCFNKIEYEDGRVAYVDFTTEIISSKKEILYCDMEVSIDDMMRIVGREHSTFHILMGYDRKGGGYVWYDRELKRHSAETIEGYHIGLSKNYPEYYAYA